MAQPGDINAVILMLIQSIDMKNATANAVVISGSCPPENPHTSKNQPKKIFGPLKGLPRYNDHGQ